MVKDEADVIEGFARHLCSEVASGGGGVIIADNQSTDGTRAILDRLARTLPLIVVDDDEPGYYQSVKMTALANMAAERGATWIAPNDADELWHARHAPLGETLLALGPTVGVVRAPIVNYLRTALDRFGYPDPFVSMIWRQAEPQDMAKVAFRWQPGCVIHQGNHGVDLPEGGEIVEAGLRVCHYPVRSARQFQTKRRNGAAAYAAAPDLPEDWGVHWRRWGAMSDGQITDAYYAGWMYKDPVKVGLVRDPAPYRRWEPITPEQDR